MDTNATPPAETPPATPPAETPPAKETPVTPAANEKPAETKPGEGDPGEANPLLNPKPEDGEKPDGEKPDGEGNEPVTISDEDFAKGITVDEGAEYAFDSDLVKEMIPHLKDAGLNPEQSKKLANELSKAQFEMVKKEAEARQTRIREWKPQIEAMVRENPAITKEWEAALAQIGKSDPVLVEVIRNTELGHSPGMLEILSLAGKALATDGGIGTQAGGSGGRKGFASVMSNGIL